MMIQEAVTIKDIPQGTLCFKKYIDIRIKSNKNFLMGITGQTGSGKSYAALSLMEIINPQRANIKNVCLNAKQFMERINSGELKKGDVLIWDEAGIDLNARKWQSVANRVINYLLQTFRNMNLIVIFTLPYFSFLDAVARKLLHCRMETVRIDYNTKSSILKPLLLQTSQESGKTYRKYLRVRLDNGGMAPVKRIRLPIPSDSLLEEYERKKSDFTRSLNLDIQQELTKSEKKKEGDNSSSLKLTNTQRLIKLMVDKGVKQKYIAEMLGVSQQAVSEHVKRVHERLKIYEIPLENEGNQG